MVVSLPISLRQSLRAFFYSIHPRYASVGIISPFAVDVADDIERGIGKGLLHEGAPLH